VKSIGKYVLVALIALAVGAFLSSKYLDNREPSITVETVTDTIIKTVVKETPIKFVDTVYVKSKPITINVPDNTTLEPTDSISVETKQYVGKEVLENGTIDYEIYADSIYATKFKLTTKDTVINTVTTITKVLPPKSRLYISGGLDIGIVTPTPQAASIGLMYNSRQKWGIGVEVKQDFSGLLPPTNSTTVGVRVYIGL